MGDRTIEDLYAMIKQSDVDFLQLEGIRLMSDFDERSRLYLGRIEFDLFDQQGRLVARISCQHDTAVDSEHCFVV